MSSEDSTTNENFIDWRKCARSIKRGPILRTLTYLHSEIEKKSFPTLIKGKYPEYGSRAARLASYRGWPRQIVQQDPEYLAQCGFFYIGSADRVRCFCCGTTLRNWVSSDDPYTEHVTWAPECPYIISLRRPLFPVISGDGNKALQINGLTGNPYSRSLAGGGGCRNRRGSRPYHDGQLATHDKRSGQLSHVGQKLVYDRGDGQFNHGCQRGSCDQRSGQLSHVGQTLVYDRGDGQFNHGCQRGSCDKEDDQMDQCDLTTDNNGRDDRPEGDGLLVSPQRGMNQQDAYGDTVMCQTAESDKEDGRPYQGSPMITINGRNCQLKHAEPTLTKRQSSGVLGPDDRTTSGSLSWCSSVDSGTFSPSEGDLEDLDLAVGRVPPAMMDSPPVLAVLDMGFSRELVETVLQLKLVRSGKAYTRAVDLFQDVERFVRPY